MNQLGLPSILSPDKVANALRAGEVTVSDVLAQGNPFCLPVALIDWYVHRLVFEYSSKAMALQFVKLGFGNRNRDFMPDGAKPFTALDKRADPWLIGRPLKEIAVEGLDPRFGSEKRAVYYVGYRPQLGHRSTMGLALLRRIERDLFAWSSRYSNAIDMGPESTRHQLEKERLANLLETWAVCGGRTSWLYAEGKVSAVMGGAMPI